MSRAGRDQAWFWSTAWQAGEAEADRDLRDGRGTVYDSDDDFLASLILEER